MAENDKKKLGIYDDLDVYNVENEKELKDVYRKWAIAYDHDNYDKLGTVSQPLSVQMFQIYVKNQDDRILDVGCGTGLVGMELAKAGFTNYDGIDISQEMLNIAKDKNYSGLFEGSLNTGLPFKDNEYDAILCVGVFTHGHVRADRLTELVRVVKSGGIICFTVNENVYSSYGFDTTILELDSNNIWRVLETKKNDYMLKKNVKAWYCVAEVI
jgi:ubiquinone/menaquinone biosynthesis C-methylase UbiE